MSAALTVHDLRISAGPLELVRGVSLSIERGQALTILGESGSGKSLLAQAIMATLPPELSVSGSIAIGAHASAAGSDDRRALWGRALALLPQEPWLALDPTMKVVGQVAEGYLDLSGAAARGEAARALGALGLSEATDKFPFMLSGGMAQRVAFAATRASAAPVLIVDEPTKGLDATLRGQLVEMLLAALHEGRALVTITHDVAVARALGGAVAIMLDGEIVEEGLAADILDRPREDYTRRLIAAQPSHWPAYPDRPFSGDMVVAGRGLSKSFGKTTVFRGVDLDIPRGARIAICGASGSGKTTLGNILLGLVQPDSGSVSRAPGLAALRLQKLYQDPPAAFVPSLSIRNALNDLAALHGLSIEDVAALMRQLGLGDHLLDRRPAQISGGELQRFALLRVLLLDPSLILADEPTSRLDPITQRETMDLLVNRAAERDCAILLITHDPDLAQKFAVQSITQLSGQC